MGFEVGQRVADYEIVSLLGVGGMSRVYGVRNVISHRAEAMKVLLADLNAEPDMAARFASEIRTLAALDHPNIAQLHTALQVGNELVMMMEFVDGLTLQQLFKQAPLPLEKVVDYLHQVMAALSYAHNRGVVHRDVKPANIMVTPEGIAKLTDFGIAKSKLEDELTRPGTTLGSLHYMSPEQARSGRLVDGRSDIYSVGMMMYELLAGSRPFEDESAYSILHSQLTVVPRPPIEVNPLLSKPLSDLISKAVEKDPAMRFQTAAALSEALHRATGIAASQPVESGSVFVPKAAVVPTAGPRIVLAAAAAETSRFTTPAHRGMWFTGAALTAGVVLVAGGVGMPRLLRTVAVAKTIAYSSPQAPSVHAVTHETLAATDSGKSVSQTMIDGPNTGAASMNAPPSATVIAPLKAAPAAEPTAISIAPTAQAAIVPARSQAPESTGAPNQRGRGAAPKLSRVAYQTTQLADETANAEEAKPVFPAPKPEILQEVRARKAGLDARAAAVRISVQRLKSEKEAAGDSLSQDIAGDYVRMNAYLSAERTDLEEGDVAAAREHIDKAEAEVNILEKLFSK